MGFIKSKYTFLLGLITKGHERSVKAKKNILASFIIRGLSIAISLVLVPLTINYVNPSRYGIWLTLGSILTWFSFFDIGLGNGLRNKFAEALAQGESELARIYLSTTYAVLGIIIGSVLFLFICINPFLNWAIILNTSHEMAGELSLLVIIVFVFFCLRFVFQLIFIVLSACQETAKASLFDFLGSLFSSAIIFILTKTTSGNLIYLGVTLSATPVLVLIVSSLWFYSRGYKKFAPSFKYVKFKYARDLMSLGINFFIIQIAVLVLFNTNNIIIAQLFGPQEVTTYNISFKLFSVITMIFFIKTMMSKMEKIWILLSIFTILILLSSPVIYKLWVGKSVEIPFALSIAMSSFVIAYVWQILHISLLNGIGKIRLQLYVALISGIINIPLAILMGKQFGLVGITLTSTLQVSVSGILYSIQTRKILSNTATRIWNK